MNSATTVKRLITVVARMLFCLPNIQLTSNIIYNEKYYAVLRLFTCGLERTNGNRRRTCRNSERSNFWWVIHPINLSRSAMYNVMGFFTLRQRCPEIRTQSYLVTLFITIPFMSHILIPFTMLKLFLYKFFFRCRYKHKFNKCFVWFLYIPQNSPLGTPFL